MRLPREKMSPETGLLWFALCFLAGVALILVVVSLVTQDELSVLDVVSLIAIAFAMTAFGLFRARNRKS